jgi:hypothetical protein
VTTWADFERAAPELAQFGAALLDQFDGLGYIATVRTSDGAPRVHPVCVWRARGRLFLSVGAASPKQWDLRTDGRYVVHALPGKDDAEFRVRGRAREVTDPATTLWVRAAGQDTGLNFSDDELLFELDVDEAHTAVWVNVGQPGTYATRRSWKSA